MTNSTLIQQKKETSSPEAVLPALKDTDRNTLHVPIVLEKTRSELQEPLPYFDTPFPER